MPIISTDYKPPFWLKNGHIHTIYPALFRKPNAVAWQREKVELSDGDFIDLDWLKNGNKKLVVLGHGLEGSSNSTYILAAANLFSKNNFDVLAWNNRSCGGQLNRLPRFYHHGVSDDLHEVFKHTAAYQEIHVVGYSLGANIVLKYLGEDWPKPQNLKSAVAVSAPVDLASSVREIHRKRNKIYHNIFLKSLREKIEKKAKVMPDKIDIAPMKKVKNLYDLDKYFTAGLHGFSSPEDYHKRASSKPFLPNITLPTLLLQAKDDPMIGAECYPFEEAQSSKHVHLIVTKFGGHVAFVQPKKQWHWMEEKALEFVQKHSEIH